MHISGLILAYWSFRVDDRRTNISSSRWLAFTFRSAISFERRTNSGPVSDTPMNVHWMNGKVSLARQIALVRFVGEYLRSEKGTPVAFFTIGHSTRSIEEFVWSLQSAGVQFIVDVRTVPRSRRNPQFNREVLPATLADFQIGYEHLAALGGLRHKRDISPAVNGYWQNQSFHNYADD